jgi:transcriptional regulator with XRE-family HTH domain
VQLVSSFPQGPRPVRRRERFSAKETKIQKLRIEAGYLQREVSEYTGISIASYKRIEYGRRPNVGVRDLAKIAAVLGVSLMDVIEDAWIDVEALRGSIQPPESKQRDA